MILVCQIILAALSIFYKGYFMANEELNAVKKKLGEMKKIELTGFTNTETATAYF